MTEEVFITKRCEGNIYVASAFFWIIEWSMAMCRSHGSFLFISEGFGKRSHPTMICMKFCQCSISALRHPKMISLPNNFLAPGSVNYEISLLLCSLLPTRGSSPWLEITNSMVVSPSFRTNFHLNFVKKSCCSQECMCHNMSMKSY